jgi:hypothetical protein
MAYGIDTGDFNFNQAFIVSWIEEISCQTNSQGY